VVVIVLQVALAVASQQKGWQLWQLPWWTWLVLVVPELVLLVALTWSLSRERLVAMDVHREVTLALFAVIGVGNGLALAALLAGIVDGREQDGGELLAKGGAIWATNVIAFGLWFWTVDRGGPVRRVEPDPPPPDFQFPQMDNPKFAQPGWHPRLFDYLYVSFTNSIAFSPTDTMPLTRRAKALMLLEATVSGVTVLLVAARAVNILG
jgi:uncharacterized membrane protein